MKVCVPTMGQNGLVELAHGHFGSAKYFTIYDTATKSVQVVENSNQHHGHGACQPLSVIASYQVDAVLTGGMGRRAVQTLNEGGIRVYLSAEGTVQEAVTKFGKNELAELLPDGACGGHAHGCD
jgi:predicted Fe-Mo cluster-binding NifX family protein